MGNLVIKDGFCCPNLFILWRGGSALIRRWIQTPSAGPVLSAVKPEGEVVLGASPPARLFPVPELRRFFP